MKGILIALCLCLSMLFAEAQTISGISDLGSTSARIAAGVKKDTIVDAVAKSQFINLGFNKASATIQLKLTKLTGTPAGVVRLEGSSDGVLYERINVTDSLVLTNVATQYKRFKIPVNMDKYIRLAVTPTGTQTTQMEAFALWRRE